MLPPFPYFFIVHVVSFWEKKNGITDNFSFISQLFPVDTNQHQPISYVSFFGVFSSNFNWGGLSEVLRFLIIVLSLVAVAKCLTLSFLLVLRKPTDCGLQSFLWIQWRIRPHDLLDERGKIHRRIRRSH